MIASSSDRTIRLYNCQEGLPEKTFNVSTTGASITKFTHHNNTVLSCGDASSQNTSIRYLSLYDNTDIAYFSGHSKPILSIEPCPGQDTFISSSMDETVRFWDLRSPVCQGLIRTGGQAKVAVDPMGVIVAIWSGSSIRLFDRTCCERGPFAELPLPSNDHFVPQSIQFSPNGVGLVACGISLDRYKPDLETGSLLFQQTPPSTSASSSDNAEIFLFDTLQDSNQSLVSKTSVSLNPAYSFASEMPSALPSAQIPAVSLFPQPNKPQNSTNMPIFSPNAELVPVRFASDGQSISVGTLSGFVLSYDASIPKGIPSEPKPSMEMLSRWEHSVNTSSPKLPITALGWNPKKAQAVSSTANETAWWIPQN